MKRLMLALALSISFASPGFASENVKWVGVVKEENGYHTPKHDYGHDLEFVKKDDGKSFDIVDSPELEDLHKQKEKNLLVEIEAEKTGRFLFWGGNLIVKSFKVLEELDDIPHHEPVRKSSSAGRSGRL